MNNAIQFSSLQSLSCVWLFVTPWIAARQTSLSITNSRHSHSSPLSRGCHPTISSSVVPFSSCPQSLQASVFSYESTLRMRWPKCWSFSLSISPSNEHPGLISFRMVWLDLLAVQGTLESLFQHHSSKASILLHSAFFIVQLSHPYIHVSLSVLVLSEYTPRSGIAGFIPVLVGFFCKYLFIDWLVCNTGLISVVLWHELT